MSLAIVEHDTSAINTLCRRCEQLDLAGWLRRGNTGNLLSTDFSLEPGCGLCTAFRDLYRHFKGYIRRDKAKWVWVGVGESQRKDEVFKFVEFRLPHKNNDYKLGYGLSLYPLPPGYTIQSTSAKLASIKRWMEDCRRLHESNESGCTPLSVSSSAKLRIIDCHTRIVRLLRKHEPYICLSYVWGSSVVIQQQQGLDSTISKDIPKTIEDAMYVAKRLGVPQLWVDQYCINQHDIRLRSATILSMDSIYGGAALTIIAASGADVFNGLPGIPEDKLPPRRALRVDQQDMLPVENLQCLVETSRWNTRGWTYQEAVLSPRKLVFTDTQYYFQCGQKNHLISIYEDFGDLCFVNDGPKLALFPPMASVDNVDALYARLEEYFPRKLTFASDSIAAFEGILNRFGSYESKTRYAKHFYGTPLFRTKEYTSTQSFVNGLAWALVDVGGNVSDSDSDSAVATGDEVGVERFPSWSWASRKAAMGSDTVRLDTEYCLRSNMEAHVNVKVMLTHSVQGSMDVADPSTLTLIQTTELDFCSHIDIDTHVMELRLTQSRLNVVKEYHLYGEMSLLDDTWQPGKHQQVLALYLGSCKDEGRRARAWIDFIFLLVERTNMEKGEYRRMGLWEFRVYREPDKRGVGNEREWYMRQKSEEEGTEYLGRRTIRVI